MPNPNPQVLQAIQASGRLDADQGFFFARELEFIRAQVQQKKRLSLNAFRIFNISTVISEGANTHTYRQWDTVGKAKIIGSDPKDIPSADVNTDEFTNNIRSIGVGYNYSFQEIRASTLTGRSLPAAKALAASRAHEELVNQLSFNGDPEYGLNGLSSITTIPEVVILADGTGSSKAFADKTADKIVRDVNELINALPIQSGGIHQATEVWMPIAQYSLLASTQNSSASDTTILNFLRANHPGVTFMPILEMAGFGAASADRMYALENTMENIRLEIPMFLRQYAPQAEGLAFNVPMESRFGGMVVEFPLSIVFADGI